MGFLIGSAISFITDAMSAIDEKFGLLESTRKRKMNDAIESFSGATTEYNKSFAKLNSISAEFGKLSSGVDNAGNNIGLTTEQFARYNEIVNELVKLNPELVKGFNSLGQAIVDPNTAIQDTIKYQQKLLENGTKEYLSKGKDIYDGYYDTLVQHRKWKRSDGGKAYINPVDEYNAERTGRYKMSKQELKNEKDPNVNNLKALRDFNNRDLEKERSQLYNVYGRDNNKYKQELETFRNNYRDEKERWIKLKAESTKMTRYLSTYLTASNEAGGLGYNFDFASKYGESWAKAFNDGLTNISMNPSLDLDQMKKAAVEFAEEFRTLMNNGGENAKDKDGKLSSVSSIIKELQTAKEQLDSSSWDADNIKQYDETVKNHTQTLRQLANEYSKSSPNISAALDSLADSYSNYANKVSIADALNLDTIGIKKARSNAAAHKQVADAGDYYTAAEGFKEILQNIKAEKNYAGRGSKTFWDGAERILGRKTLEGIDYDANKAKALLNSVQKRGLIGSGGQASANFFKELFKKADALNKIAGVDIDAKLGNFHIDPSKYEQVARYLGVSRDMLVSMLNNAQQFNQITFVNIGKLFEGIKHDKSYVKDSAGVGYISREKLMSEGQKQGMSKDEIHSTIERLLVEKKGQLKVYSLDDIKTVTDVLRKSLGDNLYVKGQGNAINFDAFATQLKTMGASSEQSRNIFNTLSTTHKFLSGNGNVVDSNNFDSSLNMLNSLLENPQTKPMVDQQQQTNAKLDTITSLMEAEFAKKNNGENTDIYKDKREQLQNKIGEYDKLDSIKAKDAYYNTNGSEIQNLITQLKDAIQHDQALVDSGRLNDRAKEQVQKNIESNKKSLGEAETAFLKYKIKAETEVDVDVKGIGGIQHIKDELEKAGFDADNAENIKAMSVIFDCMIKGETDREKVIEALDRAKVQSDNQVRYQFITSGVQNINDVFAKNGSTLTTTMRFNLVMMAAQHIVSSAGATVANYVNNIIKSIGSRASGTPGRRGVGHFTSAASGKYGNASGATLVGELGEELVWSGDHAYIVGRHTPEVVNLKPTDVVYTAEETKEILKGKGIHTSIPTAASGRGSTYWRGSSGNSRNKRRGSQRGRGRGRSGSSSGRSSSSKNSGKNPILEAYERDKKELDHLLEMEYINANVYYNKLTALYKKYLRGRKGLTDEINKSLEDQKKAYNNAYNYEKGLWEHWASMYDIGQHTLVDKLQALGERYYKGRSDYADEYRKHLEALTAIEDKAYDHYQNRLVKELEKDEISLGKYYRDTIKDMQKYLYGDRHKFKRDEATDSMYKTIIGQFDEMINKLEQEHKDKDLFNLWKPNESAARDWDNLTAKITNYMKQMGFSAKHTKEMLDKLHRHRKQAQDEIYKKDKQRIENMTDLVEKLVRQEAKDHIDALNKQSEEYKKLIDKKKEALQLAQQELTFQEEMADLASEIAKKQLEVDNLSRDTSRQGRAKYNQASEELNNLLKQQKKSIVDETNNKSNQALDKQSEIYSELVKKQVDKITEFLDNQKAVLDKVFKEINNKETNNLLNRLLDYNYKHGDGFKDTVKDFWANLKGLLERYNDNIYGVLKRLKYETKEKGEFTPPKPKDLTEPENPPVLPKTPYDMSHIKTVSLLTPDELVFGQGSNKKLNGRLIGKGLDTSMKHHSLNNGDNNYIDNIDNTTSNVNINVSPQITVNGSGNSVADIEKAGNVIANKTLATINNALNIKGVNKP